MDPIAKAFVAQMEQFAEQEKVPIVTFEKGQRKDDVTAEYRKRFSAPEGVLFTAMTNRGIDYEALDNGSPSCEDPQRRAGSLSFR
jgi:hypothetical protein